MNIRQQEIADTAKNLIELEKQSSELALVIKAKKNYLLSLSNSSDITSTSQSTLSRLKSLPKQFHSGTPEPLISTKPGYKSAAELSKHFNIKIYNVYSRVKNHGAKIRTIHTDLGRLFNVEDFAAVQAAVKPRPAPRKIQSAIA